MVFASPRDGRATTEEGGAGKRWHDERTAAAATNTCFSAIRPWPDKLDGGANITYENIAEGSIHDWT